MNRLPACALCWSATHSAGFSMLGIIAYSDADIPNTLLRLPDWLTASMLVIGGIISVLIANALTVHTLRNTIGVHQTKPVGC